MSLKIPIPSQLQNDSIVVAVLLFFFYVWRYASMVYAVIICLNIILKAHVAGNFNFGIKIEGLLKVTHITYTAKVAISPKCCKMDMFLLQVTNRKL